MPSKSTSETETVDNGLRLVSLKSIAEKLDADPSSVRRWLRAAGIQPVVMSDGPRPAIRFKADQVEAWIETRQAIA